MKFLWVNLFRSRKPRSLTACPTCHQEMAFVEKYTMGRDDIRTYRCNRCDKTHDIDFGIAMWKTMSDANRELREVESRNATQKS